jgi:archaellum biogenesis ATPase FlaH
MAAFLASRSDYDLVKQHIDSEALSPNGQVMLESITAYYGRDDQADSVDIDLLRSALDRKFKDIPRHQDRMRDYLEEILSINTSSINAVSEVLENKRAITGTHLADALMRQDTEQIEHYMQEYEQLLDATVLTNEVEEEYRGVDLADLQEMFTEQGAWHIYPNILRDKIKGGIRPGHHVVLAARPERGKTMFAVTITAGMLAQGASVLYIGNEDPIPDIIMRLLSCLSGMTEERMLEDTEKAMGLARERGYDNCTFAGLAPGNLFEIEALVRKHKPNILIVDQMRNIKAKTENNTQRLEVVAQELRNIGRRHECAVVSVTQVGDSGRDKLILNDGDIDGSNTGIPGACDVIIMIGSNEDYELRNLRHLTLAKNKRGGDHSSFTVSVQPKLSRVVNYA